MNTHIYRHLIFDKGAKTIQWKRQHFQQIVLVQLAVSMKKNANQSILSTSTKLKSKWIQDFHKN